MAATLTANSPVHGHILSPKTGKCKIFAAIFVDEFFKLGIVWLKALLAFTTQTPSQPLGQNTDK
jgi:hypothetical protein